MRIPAEYSDRKIVICLCFGGDVQEQIQDSVRGYTRENQTERISFQEWNGDRLARLILSGILREDILPKSNRSSFQKAVAMVDTPDVAYRYFSDLTHQLIKQSSGSEKAQLTSARQLNICLWILFVWARDVNNVEAPYRVSELVILNIWELCRPLIGQVTKHHEAMSLVLHQVINLHVSISFEFLDKKVLPHVDKLDGIGSSMATRSNVDVNQTLFDLLGRIAMAGMWLQWSSGRTDEDGRQTTREQLARLNSSAFKLIANNHALLLPLCDINSIEVSMVLLLAVTSNGSEGDVRAWLELMVKRLDFTLRTHGKYTCVFSDYRLLISHPRARSDEYRKEATSGSTLIPLLAAWLGALGAIDAVRTLIELKRTVLSHSTLQLWLPDNDSDALLYTGDKDHGVALSDLSIDLPYEGYINTISEACARKSAFQGLSAFTTGFWPILLLACRHYRHPVPPHFWIHLLRVPSASPTSSALPPDEP